LIYTPFEITPAVSGTSLYPSYRFLSFLTIEEPRDVICERLEKLWTQCDNFHHYQPLQAKAKELGYIFKGRFGSKKIKKCV